MSARTTPPWRVVWLATLLYGCAPCGGEGARGSDGRCYPFLGTGVITNPNDTDAPTLDTGDDPTVDTDAGDITGEYGAEGADAIWDGAAMDVARLGDVDDDGYDDYAISDYRPRDREGAVYFVDGAVRGRHDVAEADGVLRGDSEDTVWNLSDARDFDGDGVRELWVAAIGDREGRDLVGRVYLVSSDWTGDSTLAAEAEVTLVGEDDGDQAGASVADLGDVDGDGHRDVGVTAHGDDDAGEDAGATYVLYGPLSGSVALGDAPVKLLATDTGSQSSELVAGGHDTDGDGLDDVIVGDRDDGDMYEGRVFVLTEPPDGHSDVRNHATISGVRDDQGIGDGVASPGDVDGDGYADVLFGSSDYTAWIVFGPVTSRSVRDADVTLEIPEAGPTEGVTAVAGAGDVDGNGVPDVLIGAPAATSAGTAWLVTGPIPTGTIALETGADATFTGEHADDAFGIALGTSGDSNGDGAADVLICAHFTPTEGSTYLFLGR